MKEGHVELVRGDVPLRTEHIEGETLWAFLVEVRTPTYLGSAAIPELITCFQKFYVGQVHAPKIYQHIFLSLTYFFITQFKFFILVISPSYRYFCFIHYKLLVIRF